MIKSGIEAITLKMLPIPPTVNCALLGLRGLGVGGIVGGTAASGVGGVGGAAGGVGGATGSGVGVGGAFHFSLSTQVLQ